MMPTLYYSAKCLRCHKKQTRTTTSTDHASCHLLSSTKPHGLAILSCPIKKQPRMIYGDSYMRYCGNGQLRPIKSTVLTNWTRKAGVLKFGLRPPLELRYWPISPSGKKAQYRHFLSASCNIYCRSHWSCKFLINIAQEEAKIWHKDSSHCSSTILPKTSHVFLSSTIARLPSSASTHSSAAKSSSLWRVDP